MRCTTEDRFWSHVNKGDDCWEWTASLTGGYGQFKARAGESPVRASRFSWTIHFGPIPDGLLVCHQCDNPPCVRPDHLFLGTHQDNHDDMTRKGRQAAVASPAQLHRLRGQAKLTPALVTEIRRLYATGGVSMSQLAERYGVNKSNIVRAVNHKQWVDIEAEQPAAA